MKQLHLIGNLASRCRIEKHRQVLLSFSIISMFLAMRLALHLFQLEVAKVRKGLFCGSVPLLNIAALSDEK